MREKIFYGMYEGPTTVINDERTECGAIGHVVNVIAELNAGEEISVCICRQCLVEMLQMLDNENNVNTQ